ncbi:DUF3307 domain-containing protein [Virgibacillus flavescens]|uniref:DUF3307 domain-containing protein n=1 Tax=Virgibacillus flavescens TaxID=1611422 RepID=UPI003D326E32
MIKLFLLLILAHLIADFVTQTNYINRNKKIFSHAFYSKGLMLHCVHHLVLYLSFILVLLDWKTIFIPMLVVIIVLHYLVDLAKITMEKRVVQRLSEIDEDKKFLLHDVFEKRSSYFILDQVIHLLCIYLTLMIFNLSPSLPSLYQMLVVDGQALDTDIKVIALSILIVLITFGSGYFIAALMSDFQESKKEMEIAAAVSVDNETIDQLRKNLRHANTDFVINEAYRTDNEDYTLQLQYQKYNNTSKNSRGKYIGIFERILIAVFIVINQYSGLALLIAMKTLARFKQFEDKDFAEYYLIGTLLSLIMGVGIGLVINWII